MKIAHLSDIHFGRIAHPTIVDDLVADVGAHDVDLVVVSGDLTQRARTKQFLAARDMLDRFRAPVLVVPGNHDVFAWWHRPIGRIFDPLRKYRRLITPELRPTFRNACVAVLGLNTVHGLTIKGGHVDQTTREAVRSFFAGQPADVFKILVGHHHLAPLEALGRHDVARHATKTLAVMQEAGVDLYLCGHLHISHVEPIEVVPGCHRLVVASAGTATSSRGRRAHRHTNFYNLITVEEATFRIEERRYVPVQRWFEVMDETVFSREPAPDRQGC